MKALRKCIIMSGTSNMFWTGFNYVCFTVLSGSTSEWMHRAKNYPLSPYKLHGLLQGVTGVAAGVKYHGPEADNNNNDDDDE